jgi:hypothetical protein
MPKVFVRFVDRSHPGAARVLIDDREYFYVLPSLDAAPAPEKRETSIPRAVSVTSTAPSESPKAPISEPKVRPGLTVEVSVPFGPLQGKLLSQLTTDEVAGLVEWYSKVPNPQGKAKSFKKALDQFLAEKTRTVSA